MKFYFLAFTLLLSFVTTLSADVLERKGKWNVYYGYNRASYANSDYHLTGEGYDFTLKDVKARDGQAEIAASPYLIPWAWSVPQNNIHFSYFLADNFSISFGNDHMKYIMIRPQTVEFEGSIATGEGFDRSGKGTQKIDDSFFRFEHTDGLNYVSLEFEHFFPLWVSSKKTQALQAFWGPGIGIMYPKTNAILFGRARNDKFHLAGSGYSLKLGLEFNFTERYFTRLVVKHGHLDMPNVKTTSDSRDNLSQKIDFKETYMVFGLYF